MLTQGGERSEIELESNSSREKIIHAKNGPLVVTHFTRATTVRT